jgi:hypothetical protein
MSSIRTLLSAPGDVSPQTVDKHTCQGTENHGPPKVLDDLVDVPSRHIEAG